MALTDRELAIYIARRYLMAHPAQQAAVQAIIDQIEAGTFVVSASPAAVAACDDAIAFFQNCAAVTIPALQAQLTALKTSLTPI